MMRGRELTVNRCARLQGYHPPKIFWHPHRNHNYLMLGNATCVNVVHRIFGCCMRSCAFHQEDPWSNQSEINKLVENVRHARLFNVAITATASCMYVCMYAKPITPYDPTAHRASKQKPFKLQGCDIGTPKKFTLVKPVPTTTPAPRTQTIHTHDQFLHTKGCSQTS